MDSAKNPCANARAYRIKSFRQRVLSVNEARTLTRSLEEERSPAAFALRLLILTGARKSEILRARWENINLDKIILIVPVSKSGSAREILLSKAAVNITKEIEKTRSGPWLFPGRGEKCLGDIYAFWKKTRSRLGFPEARIHDLRHTFASFLVNSGHTLYETQAPLGRASPKTTMRYATLAAPAMFQAAETVSSLVKNIVPGIRRGASLG